MESAIHHAAILYAVGALYKRVTGEPLSVTVQTPTGRVIIDCDRASRFSAGPEEPRADPR